VSTANAGLSRRNICRPESISTVVKVADLPNDNDSVNLLIPGRSHQSSIRGFGVRYHRIYPI